MQLEFRWSAVLSFLRPERTLTNPKIRPNPLDQSLTEWCAEASNSLWLPELARKVTVRWNSRMRTTAGRAWWPDRAIELNPKLLEHPREELWRTLKHELAHLIAYERCGRRRIEPHGIEWQTACRDLGIPNEKPFHELPFKARRLKRNYHYSCPACGTTIARVKPFHKAVACYDCCRRYNHGMYHERFRLTLKK